MNHPLSSHYGEIHDFRTSAILYTHFSPLWVNIISNCHADKSNHANKQKWKTSLTSFRIDLPLQHLLQNMKQLISNIEESTENAAIGLDPASQNCQKNKWKTL